ncbi:MAG: hypothetical protein IPK83_24550 [Planctomycetes bacterium]|nr:hypothetical protein [Planctomycetota bacterium]
MTISRRFYTPGDIPNAAPANMAATSPETFPEHQLEWFPQRFGQLIRRAPRWRWKSMRLGGTAAEQLQCILRPVGTFNVAPAAVGVVEVRANTTTAAQGNAATGRGFNLPSLLGMQIGAPDFHAGNA